MAMDDARRKRILEAYLDALENHGMSVASISRSTSIPPTALSHFKGRGGMMGFERMCILARFLQEHGILPVEFETDIPRPLAATPPVRQGGGEDNSHPGPPGGIELTLLSLMNEAGEKGKSDVLTDLSKLSGELLSLNRQMEILKARIADARKRLEDGRQAG